MKEAGGFAWVVLAAMAACAAPSERERCLRLEAAGEYINLSAASCGCEETECPDGWDCWEHQCCNPTADEHDRCGCSKRCGEHEICTAGDCCDPREESSAGCGCGPSCQAGEACMKGTDGTYGCECEVGSPYALFDETRCNCAAACAPNMRCFNGECLCDELDPDNQNAPPGEPCGCKAPCPAEADCKGGTCVCQNAGDLFCDGECRPQAECLCEAEDHIYDDDSCACETPCAPGDSCAPCDPAEGCIAQCVCDPSKHATSNESCGCGSDCDVDANMICLNEQCVCRPSAANDNLSCGCPPVQCAANEVCLNFACQCKASAATDNNNCGCPPTSCNVSMGYQCSGFTCLCTNSSDTNCGCTGVACGPGTTCQNGLCSCEKTGSTETKCDSLDDDCDGAPDDDSVCLVCIDLADMSLWPLFLVQGDPETDGHGPTMAVTATVTQQPGLVTVTACVVLEETQPDHTTGFRCREQTIAVDGTVLSDPIFTVSYTDSDHQFDDAIAEASSFDASDIVTNVVCLGDVAGPDVTGDESGAGCLLQLSCLLVEVSP